MTIMQTYRGVVQKGRIHVLSPFNLPEGSEVYVVATGLQMAKTAVHSSLYVSPDREAMLQEQDAFQAMLPELLAKYKDQYIALHQGEVVDHDVDRVILAARLDKTHPDAVVLVKQVTAQPESVLRMRSPRLVGNG
ncbi:hypothetical protein MNBD_CHLOROFLEXI01-3744 [hydrothermal vent metagenome]|uniref:DUF5678 domain-containing protein n=1 Tax=hydrothermal vent metagenome TaxID=652676 RepID=A0A3B0VTA6_9ZZZZ